MFKCMAKNHCLLLLTLGLVCGLLMMVILLALKPTLMLAKVDLTSLMHRQLTLMQTVELSETQVEIVLQQFSQALEQVIQETAQKRKVVILPTQALLAGGVDLTDDIEQSVQHMMRSYDATS